MPNNKANTVPVHEFCPGPDRPATGKGERDVELGRHGKVGNAPHGKPGNLGRPGRTVLSDQP